MTPRGYRANPNWSLGSRSCQWWDYGRSMENAMKTCVFPGSSRHQGRQEWLQSMKLHEVDPKHPGFRMVQRCTDSKAEEGMFVVTCAQEHGRLQASLQRGRHGAIDGVSKLGSPVDSPLQKIHKDTIGISLTVSP